MISLTNGDRVVAIHPVDVPAWVAAGWSQVHDNPPIIEEKPPVIIESEEPDELDGMDWRELKAFVQELNESNPELNLIKPDDVSWDEFKPEIIKALNG